VPNVTGKTIVLAGAHHRDRVVLDASHRLRDLGAVVVVQIVTDAAVDDMRTLAAELLGHEPRIDVLAFLGARRGFDAAVLQPYLLTRLLADRIAAARGRVLWSVDGSHRRATFDPDAAPGRGRRDDGPHQLARALLVHEWARRDDRLGTASFEPDAATVVQLCGTDERLRGGHFAAGVRVADAPAACDEATAARLWERCAVACRLDP
jgi:hypothetical protein